MLKPLRIAGQPPESYYTNDVESLNKVIKQQVKYKAEELACFVMLMKQMVEKEIEKAVIN